MSRRNAAACINRLLILAAEDQNAPIIVEVESMAGTIAESLALVKTMSGIDCPIMTFCRDAVGSTAAVVAHGRRGCRQAAPGARLHFSPGTVVGSNDHHEGVHALAEVLAVDTGRTVGETLRWLQEGAEFSAQEALAVGLIDKITPFNPMAIGL